MSDWPTIQCLPTPSDAELEADRDAKHAVAVAEWFGAPWLRWLAVPLAAVSVTAGAGTARAVPIVGGSGLCPNAWSLADYIRATYPGVQSIGGVRQDRLPDHPSGHALDIRVCANTALGNMIAADIRSQAGRFGMRYLLWQQPQHYDHVHVTVA